MIVQITMTRNELFLIKEMMPLWKKYADAFVFLDDRSTDGTYEYLLENKEKYNILSVLKTNRDETHLDMESTERQKIYDEALKHSGKIICLDTDEYLDGMIDKPQLEEILEQNKDILIHLPWIQYVNENEIRIDGKWKSSICDRVGSYSKRATFMTSQMHSEHIPNPGRLASINVPHLFVAHLQWLDKKTVAVKQYYWKIVDYTNTHLYGVQTTPPSAYDGSVNNFDWERVSFDFPLKARQNIYNDHNIEESYKFQFIKESIKKYNIPNLNDWGMNIHIM